MHALLTWEVGNHFGHVAKLVGVARELVALGWEVSFALKHVTALSHFQPEYPQRLLQAPHKPGRQSPTETRFIPQSFPDDLRLVGYGEATEFTELLRAWRDLIELAQPDAVLAAAAPTALLAARMGERKRFSIGGGYDLPPLQSPMPAFRHWKPLSEHELAQREAERLAIINQALHSLGYAPLQRFSQLLEVDRAFLTTVPELDHYPQRAEQTAAADYYGPVFESGKGASCDWLEGEFKRVFVYLRPEFQRYEKFLRAIHSLGPAFDVVVASPGIPAQLKQELTNQTFRIYERAVDLARLLPRCDLGINHASSGTSYAFALAGVPCLMFPSHIEQVMAAQAMARNGLGQAMLGDFPQQEVVTRIHHLLEHREFAEAGERLANKYRSFDNNLTTATIAAEVNELSAITTR